MVRIERHNIEVTRGDSVRFTIVLEGRVLNEGTQVLVTLKSTPWEPARPVIEQNIDVVDGNKVHVFIEAEDTSMLTPGDYVWDARVIEPDGDGRTYVMTPMEYGTFRILEAIGE